MRSFLSCFCFLPGKSPLVHYSLDDFLLPITTSPAVILTEVSQNMLYKPAMPTFLTAMKQFALVVFALYNWQ